MNSPLTSSTVAEIATRSTGLSESDHNGNQTTVIRAEVVHSGTEVENQDPNAASVKLAEDLLNFQKIAARLRASLKPADNYQDRCQQAFIYANDLFVNSPTWVCFFREMLASDGIARKLFQEVEDQDRFLKSSEYAQILQMLTALRSRDLPENDPNDPQRMITVRLPKSLHEALCDEAGRLNISVNKLCISRMLQLLDHNMIPETGSKPRGRKPRTRTQRVG